MRDTEVSEWNDSSLLDRACSSPEAPAPLDPPMMNHPTEDEEEEKNDWKFSALGGGLPPAVPMEMNHPRSPTWDETVNWSKSAHRSTASGSSVGEDDSLASTQLFAFEGPDTTLHRVVSYDSSTFSSTGEGLEEMGVLTPPPAFFTPRRRLNSTVPDVPDAVTVSFGGVNGNSWSDTEDEDRLPVTNANELDAKNNSGSLTSCNWKNRLFRYFSASYRPTTHRRHPSTRRNLLCLFLIAVYTTFGLASPHLRAALPPDALSMQPLAATTTAPVLALEISDPASTQRKSLRGSSSASSSSTNSSKMGHLSFARGPQNPRQLLYRPRRDEVNAFLHQSAVEEEEAASSAWYFNCLVLVTIAIWWSLKKGERSSSLPRRS